jgi:WD40 repeat protein
MVQLASTSGTLLGYERLYNISDSIPAQNYYWDEYPIQGLAASTFLLPLNNGTVKILDITTMKIINTVSVGTASGFIGVAVNSNQTLGAIADGPSGVVEVLNLNNAQVVWRHVYNTTTGATAYPCDVRWTPNGNSLVIPMRNNNTVVTLNPANGAITADAIFPTGTAPFMLNVNSQGTLVGTELSGNKTDVFLSLPALKPVGNVALNATNFSPVRGVFTPDGQYYLVASGSSNVIDVISLSSFHLVNTLSLPPSSSPGLSDLQLTPDSNYAYVVMHGTPTTGGVIYLIPLANIATISSSSLLSSLGSIALTTAPAIALPISIKTGTYLADNVLSPPVTGLHC